MHLLTIHFRVGEIYHLGQNVEAIYTMPPAESEA